jgi:hypothetical protein
MASTGENGPIGILPDEKQINIIDPAAGVG